MANVKGTARRRAWRLWLGAAVVVGATVYLMASGFDRAATYYLSVDEALAADRENTYQGRPVRIRGVVVPGSVHEEPAALRLTFGLTSREHLATATGNRAAAAPVVATSAERITVTYRGARPDNFREGEEVIVEGRLLSGRPLKLEAGTLMVTCPSRYEPQGSQGG